MAMSTTPSEAERMPIGQILVRLLHQLRAEVFRRKRDGATSLMAKGVYTWAVDESTAAASGALGDG